MKKALTNAEKKELDGYLQDKFNYDIFYGLTTDDSYNGSWYYEAFEPLEFFRLFYKQTAFIEENKNRLSVVIEHLESLDLSGDQSYYLYDQLLDYFSNAEKEDTQIKICCLEISRLQENLNDDEETEEDEGVIETTKLEDYVKNNFDAEIVEEIENNSDLFGCEPLEFFKSLEETQSFVMQNSENPLAVKKCLKEHFPNRLYFLKCLAEKLQRYIDGYGKSAQNYSLHQIYFDIGGEGLKLQKSVELIHDERMKSGDFEAVLECLKNFSNADEKIAYLIKVKNKYKQDNFNKIDWLKNFVEKCELEIESLKQLKQLEATPKQTTDQNE